MNVFCDEVNRYISRYPYQLQNLCADALISDDVLWNIRNGRKLRKESVIALLIALGCNEDEMQQSLMNAGFLLSRSIASDVVVHWMVENCDRTSGGVLLRQINYELDALGMPLIMMKHRRTKEQRSSDI